jgi:hypothetical protein
LTLSVDELVGAALPNGVGDIGSAEPRTSTSARRSKAPVPAEGVTNVSIRHGDAQDVLEDLLLLTV